MDGAVLVGDHEHHGPRGAQGGAVLDDGAECGAAHPDTEGADGDSVQLQGGDEVDHGQVPTGEGYPLISDRRRIFGRPGSGCRLGSVRALGGRSRQRTVGAVNAQCVQEPDGSEGIVQDPLDASGGPGVSGLVPAAETLPHLGPAGHQTHPVPPPPDDFLEALLLRLGEPVEHRQPRLSEVFVGAGVEDRTQGEHAAQGHGDQREDQLGPNVHDVDSIGHQAHEITFGRGSSMPPRRLCPATPPEILLR